MNILVFGRGMLMAILDPSEVHLLSNGLFFCQERGGGIRKSHSIHQSDDNKVLQLTFITSNCKELK